MIIALSSAVLTLVCATAAGPVAPAVASGSAEAQDEAAQQAFRAGVDAARQERWPDARAYFEKAYALSPRPVVLINLAGAQARTGRLTEAAKNYRRILNAPASADTSSFRRAAAEVLPALEARIPRIRLRPSGLAPEDIIQIDGETVELEAVGSGHPLDPGEHTLLVRHAGTERARVLFTLAERELRYIALPLPAVTKRPPSSPSLSLEARPDDDGASSPSSPRARSWWASPWTWTAVAVLVAGATAVTYVALDNRQDPYMGNIVPGSIDVR